VTNNAVFVHAVIQDLQQARI